MPDQEHPMTGKRVVITGATDGIGKEIARGLARRGADLTLVARNQSKARATASELESEPGAVGGIDIVLGDLADLQSMRRAAEEISNRHDRIDVLVNNAGIHATESRVTVDGFDHTMAINHLAPFLLTNLLLEKLTAAKQARVVTTASEAHRLAVRPNLEKLAAETTYKATGSEIHYSQSKLMNIVFTQELAHRLAGTAVTANCFCPGLVDTSLADDSRLAAAGVKVLSAVGAAGQPFHGARLGIRLSSDPELATTTGRFFTTTPGFRFLPAVPALRDAEYQRRAWERSAELVGL